MLELDKHTVNDRIRLISIAALEDNKEGVLKLGGGKHKSRADADGVLSMNDQDFQDLVHHSMIQVCEFIIQQQMPFFYYIWRHECMTLSQQTWF